MKKIRIHIEEKTQTYPIIIGRGIMRKIENYLPVNAYGKIVIITDCVIEKLLLKNKPQLFSVTTDSVVLPVGERAKTIETVQEIWRELLALNADRSTLIVNIGGGVVCDVGGFAASTFMRGVDFINVPTTLLSQVDASVGGKTGVNFEEIKNIVGTFQQPKAVIIDVETLSTLPEKILTEGFAEIIKHGLIADKKYFKMVTTKKPKEFSQDELIDIITKSCAIKKKIVEKDVREGGLRRLLNFGHTVGQAIEAASFENNIPLLHGEAVSIGMVAESYISLQKKMISKKTFEDIIEKIASTGLPVRVSGMEKKTILEKMQHDKKQNNGRIQWTLLNKIGEGVVDKSVSEELINSAIERTIGL